MDEHADCGCGCHGAGTCQIPEIEIEIETPCGEVEVEIKPRYRNVGVVQANLLDLAKRVMASDKKDMEDFAKEIIKATGRDWEIHTVEKDSIFFTANIEDPATSATIEIGRDGKTTLKLEAFDDDTDYEAWDEFKWKALPSDPKMMRLKLVKAIDTKMTQFLRSL